MRGTRASFRERIGVTGKKKTSKRAGSLRHAKALPKLRKGKMIQEGTEEEDYGNTKHNLRGTVKDKNFQGLVQ